MQSFATWRFLRHYSIHFVRRQLHSCRKNVELIDVLGPPSLDFRVSLMTPSFLELCWLYTFLLSSWHICEHVDSKQTLGPEQSTWSTSRTQPYHIYGNDATAPRIQTRDRTRSTRWLLQSSREVSEQSLSSQSIACMLLSQHILQWLAFQLYQQRATCWYQLSTLDYEDWNSARMWDHQRAYSQLEARS